MVQVPKIMRTLSAWRPRRPSRPTLLKWARVSAVVLTGLAGGYIGLTLGGHVETPIGPTNTALSLHPSWTGGTTIQIPPLGALHLDTHWGPITLNASVSELREAEARKLIQNADAVDQLTTQIGGQLRHGMIVMLLRAVGLALAFSFLAGLVVFRSWRRALISLASATAGLLALSALAYWTFNPQAIAEPRYTGLLANAPQVVGDTRNLVERFTAYRAQLARQVVNLSKLYTATSTLPTYEPDPSTLRVLHVSDIHINPAAWNVIRSVSNQIQADLIIDTGDIADHGSAPEDKFVNDISSLKVPYVYVRGNHDSKGTQKAVARQKNAIVLDDQLREVEGLRIYGVGDPRFTPDKSTRDDNVGDDQLNALGTQQAAKLRASGTTPDIVAIHDPAQSQAFSGLTPLLLSGHQHARSTKLLPTGTRLFIQGSTGGAGLRGLEHEEPTPIELSVLYFSRATHRLQGWDDLRLGGLGLTSPRTPPPRPRPSPPYLPPSGPRPPRPPPEAPHPANRLCVHPGCPLCLAWSRPPSSSGLGRRPFKAVAPVRIR
jgi:predicted MPP superfamily phosphohydrolase